METRWSVERAKYITMNTELFNVPIVLSPRLKWLQKHNLTIRHDPKIKPGDECEVTGETIYPWLVYAGTFPKSGFFTGNRDAYGNTEDEALAAWARQHHKRLWNEE